MLHDNLDGARAFLMIVAFWYVRTLQGDLSRGNHDSSAATRDGIDQCWSNIVDLFVGNIVSAKAEPKHVSLSYVYDKIHDP